MGVDHVFDAVGDQFARRQRIEHAVMAHGDAVVDGDRVEFLGDTAGRFDLARDELAEILEVDVAGHELGEGIHHRNDRLAEIRNPSCPSRAKGRARPPCCGRGSWFWNDKLASVSSSIVLGNYADDAGRQESLPRAGQSCFLELS